MDPITLILAVGLTARVTRLIIDDTFPPVLAARNFILLRIPDEGSVYGLLTCHWCLSFWVGLGVFMSAHNWSTTTVWQIIAGTMTASHITGLLANYEEG